MRRPPFPIACSALFVLAAAMPILFLCHASSVALSAEPAAAKPVAREKIDRGLAAVPMGEGKVYLSWRLLADDPSTAAFNVYRKRDDGPTEKINPQPITRTTDYLDPSAGTPERLTYTVRLVSPNGRESADSPPAQISGRARPTLYVSIKLDGDHTFQKAGIADLDGDGRYDFVIKQPNANVDPYEKYWKPSPGSYKLEAYSADGKFLWRCDLGWAIEQGIWYSPYLVYDLDGDGMAEVAVKTGDLESTADPRDPDGRVTKGPEYVTILDGRTGKPAARADWPSREGFPNYNYYCRNQMAVAYLDGRTPSLIVNRGTYNLIKIEAYRYRGGKLELQWRWDNTQADRKLYWGQGAHNMHCADINGDGRDEIILGSAVLDAEGKPLWSTGLGHPDHMYLGDLDPLRPGLEIYYGIETKQKANGMCLVEAATGKIIWGLDKPTRHVHSYGMCSDIDPEHPGSECYSADTDANKDFAFGLLHSAQGKLLAETNLEKFGPRTVYWDADPQRELILGRKIVKYRGAELMRLEGTYVATVDLWGDCREELIYSVPGEMRIYTTTAPAADRRVCLMQDPIYRSDVVVGAMGYYHVPMLSYDMASQAKGAAKKPAAASPAANK